MKKRISLSQQLLAMAMAVATAALVFTPWGPQARAETSATALLRGYVSARDATGTNSVVIFPAATGRAIRLVSYQCTGDNADALLQLAAGTLNTTLSAATTTTNLTVLSTNGFAPSDVVVIQDPDDDSCTSHFVYGLGTLTVQLTAAATADSGARVYRMSHVTTNAVAAATVTRNAEALWAAQVRMPLLLRLYSGAGTTETVKDAAVKYDQYPAD